MNLQAEFSSDGHKEKKSHFIIIGPANILKIGQIIILFWAKMNFEYHRNFALAREIIHDQKFSFNAIFLS